SRLPLLQHFELIVDATYTGILKPDPRAYAAVTEALGLPAGECVFVDDQKRNADGGVKAGMRVVHFDVLQPAASFAKARRLLSLPTTA
ncbi:MAG: HAD-IA family hydrolase, partial [Hydrogenophaga sp.]|nr:HAD-IA family hydrolase [Hydrogenophaga sp.]